jgi:ABC-type antimicrobial peptide transport system permease subunit
VLRLVLGKGFALTAIGLVIGLGVGYALVRLLTSLMSPSWFDGDLLVFVGLGGSAAVIAVAGTLLPALRARSLDPLLALRQD